MGRNGRIGHEDYDPGAIGDDRPVENANNNMEYIVGHSAMSVAVRCEEVHELTTLAVAKVLPPYDKLRQLLAPTSAELPPLAASCTAVADPHMGEAVPRTERDKFVVLPPVRPTWAEVNPRDPDAFNLLHGFGPGGIRPYTVVA